MVQRYENDHGDMFQATEGDFVRYEDYAKLEAAVIALLVDINRRYPGEGFKCPLILKLAEIVEHEPRN
ncbi:hypothetical protein HSE2_gp021 [Escherichia phage vB_EcoS_HSE2]|nr:hypothetical protein HSE2_gp021 [Escherichia phage vB_EcoS_HSE2]